MQVERARDGDRGRPCWRLSMDRCHHDELGRGMPRGGDMHGASLGKATLLPLHGVVAPPAARRRLAEARSLPAQRCHEAGATKADFDADPGLLGDVETWSWLQGDAHTQVRKYSLPAARCPRNAPRGMAPAGYLPPAE